jgi:hypothetical protein
MNSSLRSTLVVLVLAPAVLSCRRSSSTPAAVEPLPSPSPVSTVRASGCGLPHGGGSGEDCPREDPSFQGEVERAIDQAVAEHPEMVNTQRVRGCGNCYQILDTHNFPEEVGRNLQKMGFCTKYDGEELAVKNTNRFNDQYDIVLAEGYIRREATGSYRSTCYPAWY